MGETSEEDAENLVRRTGEKEGEHEMVLVGEELPVVLQRPYPFIKGLHSCP